MYLAHLSLADFRSYHHLELTVGPGATVFVGANGQGKTNLVEAVAYLSTLGSHRVAQDAPLVRAGAERAVVRAELVRDGRSALVELEIVPGRANRARLNRSPVPRPREVLGIVRTVLFAPEDLAVVKGDPSERRRFLDELLVARTPRFAAVRADYDRVLKQRNALLRTAGAARRAGSAGDLRTLEVWDGHLVRLGAELLAGRLVLVDALRPRLGAAYAAVAAPAGATVPAPAGATAGVGRASSGPDAAPALGGTAAAGTEAGAAAAGSGTSTSGGAAPAGAVYRPSAQDIPLVSDRAQLEEALAAEIVTMRRQEVERGVTLVGPHRDELALSIGELPARGYASHGECWSLALAMRLASYDLLREDGDDPILLLDDVFAELDVTRRDRLAELVGPAEQVLVTAAVPDDVPAGLAGARFSVARGEVTRVT